MQLRYYMQNYIQSVNLLKEVSVDYVYNERIYGNSCLETQSKS